MAWWFLTLGLLGTIGSGAVLGAAMGLIGFAILYFVAGGATAIAVTAAWNTFTDFTLSSIPIFVLLGDVMVESGISRRVYRAIAPAFANVPGGLLHSNIVVCAIFGTVSGSSMSTAAAVGAIAYPELKRLGYDRRPVVATLAAGGTLGILIPPSLSLLIYGALTNTSIGKLFLAGVLPGLLLAAMFMAYIWFSARIRRAPAYQAPRGQRAERVGWGAALIELVPVAVLLLAVIGSIVAGLATATESAAIGVVAAILMGFVWGDLTWRGLWRALCSSAATYGVLGFVILGTVVLAQSVSVLGLPRQLVESVAAIGLSKYALLGMIILIYIILGSFFEGLSMMVMTLPLVFPLITAAGFDPVWFGVVITVLIEKAVITPPVGLNLYVLTALSNGETSLGEVSLAAVPYWCVILIMLGILVVVPEIATVLPHWAIR